MEISWAKGPILEKSVSDLVIELRKFNDDWLANKLYKGDLCAAYHDADFSLYATISTRKLEKVPNDLPKDELTIADIKKEQLLTSVMNLCEHELRKQYPTPNGKRDIWDLYDIPRHFIITGEVIAKGSRFEMQQLHGLIPIKKKKIGRHSYSLYVLPGNPNDLLEEVEDSPFFVETHEGIWLPHRSSDETFALVWVAKTGKNQLGFKSYS